MTHEDLVEAVAKAIYASDLGSWEASAWPTMDDEMRVPWMQNARAALAAVRDRAGLTATGLERAAMLFDQDGWHSDDDRAAALLRALAPGEGE